MESNIQIADLHRLAQQGEFWEYSAYKNLYNMSEDEIVCANAKSRFYRKLLYLATPAQADCPGTIDRIRVNKHLALDNDKVRIYRRSPPLPVFPAEIWIELLGFVDIETLTLLRSVSLSFRSMIDCMPKYHLVYRQAPYLIRAAIMTGVGPYINIAQLYHAYRSTKCVFSNCTNDAEFIYLLSVGRVCSVHIKKIRLFPVAVRWTKFFNESHYLLRNTPRLSVMLNRHKSSHMYLDGKRLDKLRETGVLPAWLFSRTNYANYNLHDVLQCCLKVPWLDRATGQPDWGYHCRSEQTEPYRVPGPYGRWAKMPSPARTAKTMLQHFEKCSAAQKRWRAFCTGRS